MKKIYIFDMNGKDITPYVNLIVARGEIHVINGWGIDITENCTFGVE